MSIMEINKLHLRGPNEPCVFQLYFRWITRRFAVMNTAGATEDVTAFHILHVFILFRT